MFETPKSKGHFVSAGIAPTCKMHMKVTFAGTREKPTTWVGPTKRRKYLR